MRRDLVTGREVRAVSVQGGSVAPQVSPDGKTLAYIRRVRLKSALYLRDLDSGRDRELFGSVDKDLQEAWAVHGLYPQYAWTPDGRSIVIWGEGKIWRVDASSGKGAPIPFTARVEQTINDAVRFPQKVIRRRVPGAHAARRPGIAGWQARRLQRAGQALCEGAARRIAATPDQGRAASSSSRRSRATDSGSSTRPGPMRRWDASAWSGRMARRAATWSRSRATTSSRRFRPTARRSCSATPAAIRYAAVLRRRRRHLRRARRPAASPSWCATAAPIPSSITPARGSTCARFGTRSSRCSASACLHGETALPGRDEIEHVRSDNATQFAPVAGRQVARVRGALPDLRRTVSAHRPSGRHRPGDAVVSRAARLARRRVLSALVRRQPAALLGARSGALSRAISRIPSRSRRRARSGRAERRGRSDRSRGQGHSDRLHGEERQAVGIDRAGRRAGDHDGRPRARSDRRHTRRHRERHHPDRGQPHHRGRPGVVGPGAAGGAPRRRQGQDDHARDHRRPRRISAASRAGCSRNRAGRSPPTSRSASPRRTIRRTIPRPCSRNAELIRAAAKLGPRLFSTGTILYGAETPFKAVVETLRRCAVAPAAAEGRGRVLGEELQPAAARRAADDHQGGARAPDAGRAGRRLAALHERDARARRPHRRRALAAGAAHLQGRRPAVREEPDPATRRR